MSKSSPNPRSDPRRALGAQGEALAAAWYEERGFAVIDRNWRRREGEIDLVARARSVARVLRGEGADVDAFRHALRSGDADEAAQASPARGDVAGRACGARARAALRRRVGEWHDRRRDRGRLLATPVTFLPARVVPVTPEVRRVLRDHHEMTLSPPDRAEATRADVVLQRLVRLHSLGLDVVVVPGDVAHAFREMPRRREPGTRRVQGRPSRTRRRRAPAWGGRGRGPSDSVWSRAWRLSKLRVATTSSPSP